jgi:hypothetical protein
VFFLEELADKRWKRVLAGIGAAEPPQHETRRNGVFWCSQRILDNTLQIFLRYAISATYRLSNSRLK